MPPYAFFAMSEVTGSIKVMGEPRTTTLDDVTAFDYGHPVRFQRTEPDYRGVRVAHGLLASVTEATYLKGMMPKPGFIVKVAVSESAMNSLGTGYEDHGPLPASHKIEILPKSRAGAGWKPGSLPRQHAVGAPRTVERVPESSNLDEAMERLQAYVEKNQY